MISEKDWIRIARHVTAEGDPEEREELAAWVDADEERRALAREVQRVWDMTGEVGSLDAAYGWNRVEAAIEGEATPEVISGWKETDVSRWMGRRRWFAVSIGLAAGLAALALVDRAWEVFSRDTGPEIRRFATDVGERRTALLADGSEVLLSVQSRIEVLEPFGTGERVVHLVGEAFFEVADDVDRPFVVNVRGAVVRVVGTEFGVRAYDTDPETEVVVASGRVAVSGTDATGAGEVEVVSGQLARVDRELGTMMVESVDLETYLLRQQGRIAFHNVPFKDVLREVQRWYDVQLEVRDGVLSERRLMATFDLEKDPLADVLHTLALAANATYSVNGRTVIFEPNPA